MSFALRRSVVPAARRAFTTTTPRPVARINILGNLADTPELHTTSGGREVVRYAVASNSGSRENRKTSWFRVISFADGNSRQFLLGIPKGSTVFVEGDASTNNYTDSNGQIKNSFSVVQRSIEVVRRNHQSGGAEEVAAEQEE